MFSKDFDPANVYVHIRTSRNVNPVDVYNSQVDLPLILSGPSLLTITIGRTPAGRILEIEDEQDMDSPFALSAIVQFDRHTYAPKAFCFGHLSWAVRVVIPTPYPSFCQPELSTFLADLGPFLGVDLTVNMAKFNSLLFSQTGRALLVIAAPPMDAQLRAAFLEMLAQAPPDGRQVRRLTRS
jgi:hypothetical protein